ALAIALSALATPALACDLPGGGCGVDARAFKKVLNHYCDGGGTYINEVGALDVAQRSAAGQIDVDNYLYRFDKTCRHSSAVTVGTESRQGKLDMSSYKRAIFEYCSTGGHYLTHDGAVGVAEKAAAGTLDVGNYLWAWDKTCDVGTADAVGTETKSG